MSLYTLAGAVLIVGGCLVAARGKIAAPPEIDVAGLADAQHVDGEGEHADVERERGEAVERSRPCGCAFAVIARPTSRTPSRR